jgi:hypothetical protein
MRGLALAALKGGTFSVLAGVLWFGGAPRAEAGQFCPSAVTQTVFPSPSNDLSFPETFTFGGFGAQPVNGACTNNGQSPVDPAAFSGAALASQALSELSQSTTQETARSAENSVANRRDQEEQRCAEGFSRVDGVCERNPAPVAEETPPPEPAPAPTRERPSKKAKKTKAGAAPAREEVKQPPVRKVVYARRAPAFVPRPAPVEAPFRYGVWGQVFGEYEKRDATGSVSISGPDFNAGLPVPIAISVQSRTGTVGFQAGLDLTSRGLIAANDGLIAGVLVGYISSNMTLNTTSISSNPSIVNNGLSRLTAQLSGPTLGTYATYFSGNFSTDMMAKFDILSLNQSFNDNLAFAGPFGPFNSNFSGAGSASLLNSMVAANLNYRFNVYPNFWIEPTVGAQFTALSYGGGAAQLGLEDGQQVMVQGGARVGTTSVFSNAILMTTTLTGLAYDDVVVHGGFIPGAAFQGNNILADADRGQVRGRGILAFNFDFGQGLTSFVQGDVHGGTGLFGAGGKAGIRYQW